MLAADLPISLVVTDRPCRGIDIARDAGVSAVLVERTDFGDEFDRGTYTAKIERVLDEHNIELVAMAGFGTILGASVFDAFRVINTHPALLPSFKGWHAVRDALEFGVKVTGCTIHVATAEVDDGPILAQEAVAIEAHDDEASLHERIKAVERRLYVDTLQSIERTGQLLGEPLSG